MWDCMVGVHPEDRSCTKVHCHERALYFKSTAAHPSSSNATCCSLLTPPTPPHCLLCAHPPPLSHSPSHLLLLAAGYFVLSSVAGIVRSVGGACIIHCDSVSVALSNVCALGWVAKADKRYCEQFAMTGGVGWPNAPWVLSCVHLSQITSPGSLWLQLRVTVLCSV